MAHFEKASKEGARIAEKTAEVQTDNFSAKDMLKDVHFFPFVITYWQF